MGTTAAIGAELAAVFDRAGADATIYARDLATGEDLGIAEDRPVVTASVFKIPIMLAYAADVASGLLDPLERVVVTPRERVAGPTGLSVFSDTVELSLRDLALLMMTVSDNTATDLVLERVGLERVNGLLDALGLTATRVTSGARAIVDPAMAVLEAAEAAGGGGVDRAVLDRLAALDPARTCRTTAREIVELLTGVWSDHAASAAACAEVRRVMALQVWPHRILSGLPDGYRWAGKTGTLPGVRNEAGVVTTPGGGRIAVAIFTRAHDYRDNRPEIDQAMGVAALRAVRWLTGRR